MVHYNPLKPHVTVQDEASLVNDCGASTLVRQDLSRPELLRGKRVVIWEFVERDLRFGTKGRKIVPSRD